MNAENRIPSVAVVVPCYNYGHYLPGCVDSVLGQNGVDVRVLVIDDASPDGSGMVAEQLAERDRRVTARVHTTNKGHIATYNEGLLGWADSDYVTLLSADDVLTPGSLARSVGVMERHRDVVMVYGRAVEFEVDMPRLPSARPRTVVWPGGRWLERRFREAVNVVPNPGVVLRTRTQVEIGGYDPLLPHAGDLEMWLRAAAAGSLGFVRGPAQAGYRVHPASMSQGVYRDRLADVRERLHVFDRFLDAHGDVLVDAPHWRGEVGKALAVEVLRKACQAYEHGRRDDINMVETVEFLDGAHPGWRRLPAARALRRRQALGGSNRVRWWFAGTTAARRAQDVLWWSNWRLRGG